MNADRTTLKSWPAKIPKPKNQILIALSCSSAYYTIATIALKYVMGNDIK